MFGNFTEIPIQEQFSFCFNTVLCDIAAHFPDRRDTVIAAQLNLLVYTTSAISDICQEEKPTIQVKGSFLGNLLISNFSVISYTIYWTLMEFQK